jgi:hypothetical protein
MLTQDSHWGFDLGLSAAGAAGLARRSRLPIMRL